MIADAANAGRGLGLPSARHLGYGVAFLGLGAIGVGCFLPVADEGSVDFDRIHDNSLRPSGIGWLTLLLCGMLVITLTRSLHRGGRTWGALVGGLLVLAEVVYVGAAELTTCPVGTNLVDSSVCQAASPGLGLFIIGAGGAALALAGLELAPWRQFVSARAASAVSHDGSNETTIHARPAPSLDSERVTAADVGTHVTAILIAAEEMARKIVADARAEAARITPTASESRELEQANAERQRRLDEEAAWLETLLRVSRAVEEQLRGAMRELSAITDSHSGSIVTPPRQTDRRARSTTGNRPGR